MLIRQKSISKDNVTFVLCNFGRKWKFSSEEDSIDIYNVGIERSKITIDLIVTLYEKALIGKANSFDNSAVNQRSLEAPIIHGNPGTPVLERDVAGKRLLAGAGGIQ